MIANFFRTRKGKKKAPVRAFFRPTLESLEDRAVPASLSLTGFSTGGQGYVTQATTGGQTATTQAAQYMQALAHASPAQLASIQSDVITAWTSGTQLMAAASGQNSTVNVNAELTAYMNAVTDLFTQMNNLVQSNSSSANSTSSSGTGFSLIPSASSPTSTSSSGTGYYMLPVGPTMSGLGVST